MNTTTEAPKLSIYQEHGYANRMEYLKSLSQEYGIDLAMVCAAADMLGKNEDFDGLVTTLEDESYG
jgi:hypothetical protein